MLRPALALGLVALAFACGSDPAGEESSEATAESESDDAETGESGDGETGDPDLADPSEAGPYTVGHTQITIQGADARSLPVEIWYPAEAVTSAPSTLVDYGLDGAQSQALQELLDAAPAECPRVQGEAHRDAPVAPSSDPFPALVFSHCHVCTRFSSAFIAERLASHGFVVFGVDHVDNTLFDELDGEAEGVSADFLQVRGTDVRAVLDVIESDAAPLPEALRSHIDAQALGVFGHSFGAATTGLVLQDDPRVRAGVAIAAPVESLLLPGVAVADIAEPMLFLLAREDNSITEVGNNFIRDNFAALPAPAWLVEVEDAGHWSFSDICGMTDLFMPGCGEDERQTLPGESFTYLENATARDLAADYVTAFFAWELEARETGLALLEASHPSGAASVDAHD